MSETITYTAGMGPHEGEELAASIRLGQINARAYLAALQADEPEPLRMGIAARAVAAEVLSDPAGYARALGLPLPTDGPEPVAGLG